MIERLGPVTKETWLMDLEVVGFGIRMRPNCKAVYAMRWKDPMSRDRKLKIGAVSQVELEDARAIARQRFGEIARGDNPLETRKSEKTQTHTISDVIEAVVEEIETKGRAGSYIRDFQQQMRDHVEPSIGTMLVREVTTNDVDRILQRLRDKAALHNRVRAALSRVFKLAVRWRYRPDDPSLGTSPQQERHRDRLLSEAEIDALLAALERHPGQSSDAMRLLYLTGSRPQELFSAKWGDLDLEAGIWTKPAQYVKQRRTHRVELHEVALAVFKRIRDERAAALPEKPIQPDDYVFPGSGKSGHLTTVKRHAQAIFAEADLTDVRPYDLRKAFASRLIAAGVDITTVMSLTGHTQVQVLLKHYSHVMEGKQREALGKVFDR